MSDASRAADAELLAKLIRALWLRTAPSQEAQRLRGELSTAIDDPRFPTWALDSLPDCVWDLIDVAVQRALDTRDAALREANAEIERLRAQLAPATREHAVTRSVLAISTEDLIHRLRQHVRNRGAPHLPNGAWALMLEAANQLESASPPPPDALREAHAEIERIRKVGARIAVDKALARAEIRQLRAIERAARDLWRVGAPLRDKLPALAAALDALDAQPQPRKEPHA